VNRFRSSSPKSRAVESETTSATRRLRISPAHEELPQVREQLELAIDLYAGADSVLETPARGAAECAARAAGSAVSAAQREAKVEEIESSIRQLTEQAAALQANLAAEDGSARSCDETPWQAELQQALYARTEREQALAQARDASKQRKRA
jgi:hypothetical protein